MIKIQKEDFNIEKEINFLKLKYSNIGAVSTFIGYVRNINNSKKVKSINIEVYEKMAIKSLSTICEKAHQKWNIVDSLIIHRYGSLAVNEKIVLVATFSIHRKDSMESCNYIMEYLKREAPFWKKEIYEKNSAWL